jgi:hypothetical protein
LIDLFVEPEAVGDLRIRRVSQHRVAAADHDWNVCEGDLKPLAAAWDSSRRRRSSVPPRSRWRKLAIRRHLVLGVMRRIPPSGGPAASSPDDHSGDRFGDIEYGKEVGLRRIPGRGSQVEGSAACLLAGSGARAVARRNCEEEHRVVEGYARRPLMLRSLP